jgi:hypothetical protein
LGKKYFLEVVCMTAKDLFEQVRKTVTHYEKPKSKSIGENENRALLAGEEAKLQQLNYASQINH